MKPLKVEDGTNVAGADSWVKGSEVDAYHDNMGNTAWAAVDDDVKTASIRGAASYLVRRYRADWKGTKANQTQALPWPRKGATDEDGFDLLKTDIPRVLKDAQCEVALLIATGQIDMRPVYQHGGRVSMESVSVQGAVTESTTYASDAPIGPTFPWLDEMLSGILMSWGSLSSALVRG